MLETILEALPALSHEELRALNQEVVNQLRSTRAVANVQAILTLKVGDQGTLQNLRGKYNGQPCEVVEIRRSKVVVKTPNFVDYRSGRPAEVVVPASCVAVC